MSDWLALFLLRDGLRLLNGFFLLDRLGFGSGLRHMNRLRLTRLGRSHVIIVKGSLEVSAAIRTKTDAGGQLLATTVTKSGGVLLGFFDHNRVTVGSIRVVTDNQCTTLITAHSKTLRTHDLAIVYHQFLLRDGHPFAALWALEFHNLVDTLMWVQR